MCGISVIVSPDASALPEAIGRMVASMHHRGPDGTGTYLDRVSDAVSLALGHNRLAIIDLTDHAAQPMRSLDGRYVLVYNGEVYNYREIAAELDRAELPAEGTGDTAVVLAAITKWGPAALAKFNGMWSLALYDTRERTLLVSRDRFGVKPLYYCQEGATLYFASEIKAILLASRARLRINPDVAIPYLTRGLLNFSEGTFFDGVRQFPPASYQVIDLRSTAARFVPAPRRYWRHPYENGEVPAVGRVSADEVRSLFMDAVTLRLRSDVPVGVLLSGGIDSSSIVGAIARTTSLDNLTVLSVTSDDRTLNEEPFVDLMARHVNLTPQKFNVSRDPESLLASVSDACWFNDEPVCGIADIAHLRLMEGARARGIKVLLSGQGADEQLGGYNKFLYFWMQSLIKDGRYGKALQTFLQSATHSHTLYEFRLSEAIRYIGRSRLATKTFIAPVHQHRDAADLGLQGSYASREWIDLVRTSVPALLHYEDRMSMSRSVEVRVPFLDYRLVECLARVHPSEKFEGGWSKAIFRKAIVGLVPRQIQYRRDKKGFGVPEDDWMKHVLRPHLEEMFAPGMMAETLGLVDSCKLREMYSRFVSGSGYLNGRHFCRVYAFEAFARRFAAHIQS
jgi:asparagine synthase (glutamine-hydrolysing)